MASSNNPKLSHRQRQSQQIIRQKSSRKRWDNIRRKGILVLSITGGLTITGAAGWLWYSGVIERTVQAGYDRFYAYTVEKGYGIKTLYLEGRNRTSMEEISKALGVKKKDPILRLSLDDAKARLEAIGSIKYAAVERELPSTLTVRIVEREPVALWQYQGKVQLIDDNGVVMSDLKSSNYPHLPLLVGEGAPEQVTEFLALLESEPELVPQFQAAIWVGQRRWNVRLTSGIEILLPEEGTQEAWHRLATLDREQKILTRHIEVIDLRVAGRLFITPSPNDKTSHMALAKET